jgi:hypothetical protein
VASALAGAAWAWLLLPPQLVLWDGPNAPSWARSVNSWPIYDLLGGLDGAGGMDLYAWSGVLLVPAWILIGWPLLLYGRLPGVVGALFLLGAPVSVASYLAETAASPWHYLWGAEIFVLLAIPIAAIPAAVSARARHFPTWWWLLMVCTFAVTLGSTAVFGYFPHGTLVGLGVEVAFLTRLPVGGTSRACESGPDPTPWGRSHGQSD